MDKVNIEGVEHVITKGGNVHPEIKWEDGAVCFGNGKQWYFNDGGKHNRPLVNIVGNEFVSFDFIIGSDDFQLNEIIQDDYIEASELDTEQKYNDAVEVFGLFGFNPYLNNGLDKAEFIEYAIANSLGLIVDSDGDLVLDYNEPHDVEQRKRKITYPQLMAIGKLKRARIEGDGEMLSNNLKAAADKLHVSLEGAEWPDLTKYPYGNFDGGKCNSNWSDKHYNHFYQLTEEDIERGEVKVDAYFVNRMWKINSWEDTGAGFHILKTLPRIANNKNSLKRELVALKKQIDILCKLHGVDDDTTN